ncbi:MAG: DUF6754 domain-containing protein [Candidatus Delongbacteria bacterium]
MKRILLFLYILFPIMVLYSQNESLTEPLIDGISGEKAIEEEQDLVVGEEKELTKEEQLCKEAAEELAAIHESWDVTRDYDILMPRLVSYVDNYYSRDIGPDRQMETQLLIVIESINNILSIGVSDLLSGLLEENRAWAEKEIKGEPANPALIGYITKPDQDKQNAINDLIAIEAESKPEINGPASKMQNAYTIIKRLSIGFERMLDNVYSETTRVTDKRVDFLYIDDDVQNRIEKIAKKLGDYIRSNRENYIAGMKKEVEDAYQAKKEAESKGNEEEIEKYHQLWLDAKAVTIDNIYSAEVTRLLGVVNEFRTSTGTYDVNAELIRMIRDNDPELEKYFKNILKVKFSQDIISAYRKYFRFNVDKGFRTYRTNVFIFTLMFFGLFFYVFHTVKKKRDSIYIRKIPGLDAIDDAVGRATEMGKPIVYDSGIGNFVDPMTIASMLILRSVAKKVAEFKAEIIYPAYDPIVLQVAEEMVASGFLDAGYPEDHKKDNCFFLVQDQFAFAAGLSGIIARKKPATALHFGNYAAESLLIAEAGFAAGSIQVAGTVAASQLPFFITACDYTLIGEELYAAAAYLSRDSQILSNLKLSDYGKLLFGSLFVISTILLTINAEWTFIRDILTTH